MTEYRTTSQAPSVVSHRVSDLRLPCILWEKVEERFLQLTVGLAAVGKLLCCPVSAFTIPQIPSQAGSHQQREALL